MAKLVTEGLIALTTGKKRQNNIEELTKKLKGVMSKTWKDLREDITENLLPPDVQDMLKLKQLEQEKEQENN